ncbi:MAG: glycosyltransferase family 10 [Methanogenium sp.]|jgi:hypothetical protein
MKLRTNFIDIPIFEKLAVHLKNVDFTLFADTMPTCEEDLSKINVLVLQEPNEYFGLHTAAIKHNCLFDVILTWDEYVLNNCDNSRFLLFGHTWLIEEQYKAAHIKEHKLSHLRGNLLKSYGHQIRWDVYERRNEIKALPLNFYDTYGNRNDIEDARKGKEFVFGNSLFGVAIENFSHHNYFTEKILDCFLMKTMPLYWGCSNIEKYFDETGIIKFENADDLIDKANGLTKSYYEKHIDAVNKNYEKALKYVSFEKNIIDKITELFKYNGII